MAAKIQDLWLAELFELVTSVEILKEVAGVMQYPKIQKHFQPNPETLRQFFTLVFTKAVITQDTYKTDILSKDPKDPKDNKFLACALEGKADFIVSGDKHLLDLKQFHGIQIVDAKSFVNKITESKSG